MKAKDKRITVKIIYFYLKLANFCVKHYPSHVISVSRVLGRMDFGLFNAGNHDKIESNI